MHLRWLALTFFTLAGCGADTSGICSDYANASCPSDYPSLYLPHGEDGCNGNFGFACGSQNCDLEYEARILCETDNPTCCNSDECIESSACDSEIAAWDDCVSRVRDACDM